MKFQKILPLFFVFTLLLTGCGNSSGSENGSSNSNNTESSSSETAAEADFTQTDAEMFTDRDSNTDYKYDAVTIQLNGTSASCDSDTVQIDGSTIRITTEGTYVFSGKLENGMIIVDAGENEKPQLVFNNVEITSASCAPLYILEADKVFITLADSSTNSLTNGGNFTAIDENNIDGTIYSKQDITFNGSGSLIVNSPAGHGIVAKDDLVFTSGNYSITASSHGIDANDSLRVKNGNITIVSGKDGVHVENNDDAELGFIYISNGTFDITAEGDGLSASSYAQINNGAFTILTGGGYENGTKSSSDNWGNFGGNMGVPGDKLPGGNRPDGGRRDNTNNINNTNNTDNTDNTDNTENASTSMKGIKAGNSLLINNGTFLIDSADDAIHSDISVYVNSGTYTIASGDDALHSEDKLNITNGTITITNSYEGLEALHITISGGSYSIQSTDDGINAAGGTDASGTTAGRDGMFENTTGEFKGGMNAPGSKHPSGNMGNGMSQNSNGSITITGGNIFMYAQGDGLDANGYIELTGGHIVVTGPTSGDTAILDYDTTATINGATFIGVGSTMMAQTFSDGTQGTIAVQASGNGGTSIRIEDSNENEIISYTPKTPFQCIIISTPNIIKGDNYTIYVGEQSGTLQAN